MPLSYNESPKIGERKINERFRVGGLEFQCLECPPQTCACELCVCCYDFKCKKCTMGDTFGCCTAIYRTDKKQVYFKLIN